MGTLAEHNQMVRYFSENPHLIDPAIQLVFREVGIASSYKEIGRCDLLCLAPEITYVVECKSSNNKRRVKEGRKQLKEQMDYLARYFRNLRGMLILKTGELSEGRYTMEIIEYGG
jgi:RecB family endonuclease NucS